MKTITFNNKQFYFFYVLFGLIILYGCSATTDKQAFVQAIQSLPVVSVKDIPVTTYQEFTASIEGTKNVEIRPLVDGYLEGIYVDEGNSVKKGQLLFKINDAPFIEQLNNAKANLLANRANLIKAEIEVNRLAPLVQNNIVSDVQLKSAQSAREAATANVALAEAMVNSAQINLGYTHIIAPVDGYIGKIPYKIGSVVGKAGAQALTVLSDVKEVYAYFSMSETDFMQFGKQLPDQTMVEKISHLPQIELVLADNSIYPLKGKVETVVGQFDRTMGTISFRAIFPNANGFLRSGNTGKVRIPHQFASAIVIPQEATFDLQDKVFVFALADSNKVSSQPISIIGKSNTYYLVEKGGVKPGEKIVFAGLSRLRDGVVINPKEISMDSLLLANPL
jgi:membrane fusion protein, multidrug efflux system